VKVVRRDILEKVTKKSFGGFCLTVSLQTIKIEREVEEREREREVEERERER